MNILKIYHIEVTMGEGGAPYKYQYLLVNYNFNIPIFTNALFKNKSHNRKKQQIILQIRKTKSRNIKGDVIIHPKNSTHLNIRMQT